jgi:hypothetical protein
MPASPTYGICSAGSKRWGRNPAEHRQRGHANIILLIRFSGGAYNPEGLESRVFFQRTLTSHWPRQLISSPADSLLNAIFQWNRSLVEAGLTGPLVVSRDRLPLEMPFDAQAV